MLNEDFKDMLRCLRDEKVEFLLVGGYAMAAHGFPRATKDIDFWVFPNEANSRRTYAALARFGAPMDQINESDFARPGNVFQIGVPPRRIDITTIVQGVEFRQCAQRADHVTWDDIQVPVMAKPDLIQNKLAVGRPQDLVDAETLKSFP